MMEEEIHRKVLLEVANGRQASTVFEAPDEQRLYLDMANVKPLDPAALARWGEDLFEALELEEKTWIFYGNLRRIGKVPEIQKAIEALATMEKGHFLLLGGLLGATARKRNTAETLLP